jgi:hypothetical protein
VFCFLFPKTVVLIEVIYFTIGSILRGLEERDRHSVETVTADSEAVASVHVLHLNTDTGELLTYRNSLHFYFCDLLLAIRYNATREIKIPGKVPVHFS